MAVPRVSVIGIGSPYGDDRAGWRVAELLAKSARVAGHAGQVSVTACRSPSGELPGLLAATDVAIVIDAVVNGGAPGTVYRLSSPRLRPYPSARLSSHGVGVQAMFALAETLEDAPSVLVIYGIEAESVAVEAEMSRGAHRAIFRVREEIERDIAYFCGR